MSGKNFSTGIILPFTEERNPETWRKRNEK
jgi:hypothetical protein